MFFLGVEGVYEFASEFADEKDDGNASERDTDKANESSADSAEGVTAGDLNYLTRYECYHDLHRAQKNHAYCTDNVISFNKCANSLRVRKIFSEQENKKHRKCDKECGYYAEYDRGAAFFG